MGITLLLQNIAAAFSVGLGCGTCCGSTAGVFMTSYTMSHAKNVKKALLTFLCFFLGKFLAVVMVCVCASFLGAHFIDEEGYIGKVNLNDSLQIGLIVVGVILIINWIRMFISEKKECKECKGKCHEHSSSDDKLNKWPPVVIGFVYGITPCAPLILMAGYSAAMSAAGAMIIALTFSISSSLTPMLLMVLIAGVLSKKMYDEIPKYINGLKLSCYIFFVAMAITML